MVHNPDDYAIVVGINNYSQLRRLKGAHKDAYAFAQWLILPDGGGLPPENVRLIVSPDKPPVDPFDARPVQRDIDKALRDFGFLPGRKIGRRFYFYFAGHSVGSTFDEVCMLMADAAMDRLDNAVSLRLYRQFVSETGRFDEVVFIADCCRAPIKVAPLGPPFSPQLAAPASLVAEFVVLTAVYGEKAFAPIDDITGEPRGLLTQAILEGLQKPEAADEQGRFTTSTLREYVRKRVPELADTLDKTDKRLQQEPEIIASNRDIVFATFGQLRVELPHWTAEIRIFDNLLQPVSSASWKRGGQVSSRVDSVEATLSPGIYTVEISLAGKAERAPAVVRLNQSTTLPRTTWKGLTFESSAPLATSGKARKTHTKHAEEWSRQTTWAAAPGGDSRLFIFVRTLDPERYPTFAEGLSLLGAEGKLLTDFSTSVKRNKRGGWMAFNADLPAGYYILRRGRSGVRIRQQPVYLCSGWETQVFIEAQNAPSLRTLTINMASRGAGFRADDEIALACEVVFDSLGRNERSRSVVAREKIDVLIGDKLENPWLGILAAYALRRAQEQGVGSQDTNDLTTRYQHVMAFLNVIGDHPDVRALNLSENEPAGSFWHPPLLRAGLKWVQEHATRFADTIPLESLTDVVLDNLVVNSPWTAWRELDRTPRPADSVPQLTTRATKRSSPQERAEATSPRFTYSGQFIDHDLTLDASLEASAKGVQPQRSAPITRDVLYEASLVQFTQSLSQERLSQVGGLDTLQETVEVNPTLKITDLLSNITAQEVSAATGLPLARIEQTLADLSQDSEGAQEALNSPLTATERAIIEYALQAANRPTPTYAVADMPAPAADESVTAADTPIVAEIQSGVIEESVSKLRVEADRLVLMAGDNSYAAEAHALGERLYKVTNHLLQQADFSVRTDVQVHVQQPNGAFLALLTPQIAATDDESKLQQKRLAIQRTWEAALTAAPSGHSILPHPVPDQSFPAWDLHRTAILDGYSQAIQAYLYVFRSTHPPQLASDVFQQIKSLLSELALYASLCAYGVAQGGGGYLQKLAAIVLRLEQLTASGTP